MSRLHVQLVVLLCLLGGPLAWTGVVPAAEESRDELVEYVEVNVSELPTSNTIATKLPTALQLTPANVGSVGSALLREQDAVVLGDALRNISGLNIQAGPAVFDFFAIRGFDSLSSGLVLTDGASEPESTFYQLYNVEGVEVLKGPGGFLYGSNPLAGTVNMVRKQPLPGDFAILGGSIGSLSTYEGTVDWNTASDDGGRAFRLNAIWNESDHERDDKKSEYVAANPSFTFKPNDRSTYNFNVEVGSADYSPDSGLALYDPDGTGLRIPEVSRRTSYQAPIEFSEQDVARFQFNFETRPSERLTLRNKLYYRSLDWQSAGSLLNGAVDLGAGPQVLRTLTVLDDNQEFVGNQFEAVVRVETGSIQHSILGGVEIARYADEFELAVLPPQFSVTPFGPFPCDPSASGMPCIDLFDPVETFHEIPDSSELTPLGRGDARSNVVAPYVIDQLEFTEKFELFVGARYDDIDFEDTVSDRSRDDSEISPMIGAVFAPDPSLSIYANTGKSYAPPSSRVVGVDPETLEPEESTQVELGVKKKFLEGKLRTTFAVYRIDRENIAIPDETAFLQQLGDQQSDGFEIELAAEPLPKLLTFLSYAYNDSELTHFSDFDAFSGTLRDFSGNTSPYAPEHLVNLWVSRSFSGGLGVAGGARYFSEQFFNADNAFEVDGALVFDAAAFYDLEAWRFKLNLKNLTDEEYETGSFASTSVVPADPFTATLSFDYRF